MTCLLNESIVNSSHSVCCQNPIPLLCLTCIRSLGYQFEDCTFDWLYWPQAHQPYSPDTVDYIKSLDAEKDIALLEFYGWDISPECARTLRLSTMLLKKGVERGLTPFAIGSIMCRETVNKVSAIEEMVREAEDCLLPGMSEAAFLETISPIMDSRLDELAVK